MDARPTLVPTESSYSFPLVTIPIAESQAQGRELRAKVPRRSFAEFRAPDRDPVAIIEEQNEDRIPELVPIRIGRMLQSPFSYFRGTAGVMAHDLAHEARTDLELVVCGDAHISNFGLFASPERRVLFDLNDFDETAFGPWEWDVKRLVASAVIGGRDLGFTTAQCTDAAMGAADGYRTSLRSLYQLNALERFYFRVETDWLEAEADAESRRLLRKTIKKARRRTSDQVLAKITTTNEDGVLHIVDEFPVIRHEASADMRRAAPLYDAYRRTVRTDVGLLLEQFRLVDTVRRIVGVGSVGTRCGIALLLGPAEEALFLQIKEAPPSVLETYGKLRADSTRGSSDNKTGREGWRVVAGQRVLQAASDPFLGWITFDARDYYLRQFRDMKGAIELDALSPSQFNGYTALCGAVLARAHAQSREAATVVGYLGRSARFDEAVTAWAHRYADQIELDYAALQRAMRAGRLPAEEGV